MTTFNSGFYLNSKHLEELVSRYQNSYRQAKPFPHIVIDNFLPPEVAEQIVDELAVIDSFEWQQLNLPEASKMVGKLSDLPPQSRLGDITRCLLYQLNSTVFLSFLEELTGAEGLLANPQIESSGLQSLKQSRPFKIPVEAGQYSQSLDRKLTFLIYLNQNWKEEYGGHLELWNAEMTRCEKKILPIFNRCVIFSTTSVSYYGHPEPLNCPDHETRKLLALYYYGKERSTVVTSNPLPPPNHSCSSREIMPLDRQPMEVLFKAFIKTFIKKLIPASGRT